MRPAILSCTELKQLIPAYMERFGHPNVMYSNEQCIASGDTCQVYKATISGKVSSIILFYSLGYTQYTRSLTFCYRLLLLKS
jgi:hypothetical protein